MENNRLDNYEIIKNNSKEIIKNDVHLCSKIGPVVFTTRRANEFVRLIEDVKNLISFLHF